MLYLIKQESKDNTYYKIGYAKDILERMKAYNTHNAEYELVDYFEGDTLHENVLHKYLKEFKVPNRKEWFYFDAKVLQIWNMYKDIYSAFSYDKLKEENEQLRNSFEILKDAIERYNKMVTKYEHILEIEMERMKKEMERLRKYEHVEEGEIVSDKF